MINHKRIYLLLILIIFTSISNGCASNQNFYSDNQSIITPTIDTIQPAAIHTNTYSETEVVMLENVSDPSLIGFRGSLHNLWTIIDREKISVYMYDWISDYVFAEDDSLWMVGGFGVIHRMPNGEQTWYSIKDSLPHQFFTQVAISPSGEVWIGGTENALFRFNGSEWIDEGTRLPTPREDDYGWLCYSKEISGIDFAPDGSVWVMNSGIEIYAQAYGQWMSFPFPKEILPIAGGGGCPLGIHVLSEDDITIMRNGCCMSGPTGYHFDGETWTSYADYSGVERLLELRHQANFDEFYYSIYGSTQDSSFDEWPFDPNELLPRYLYPSWNRKYLITTDIDDVIWISRLGDLYNNSTGKFEELYSQGYINENSDISQSKIVNFGSEALYYQQGKLPYQFRRYINDSSINNNSGYVDISHITTGNNNQIWFYSSDQGLILVDHGDIHVVSEIPEKLYPPKIGGVYIFNDGRIWVGSTGVIWEFISDQWRKIIIPDSDELFIFFAEASNGVVYGATDTSVYKFDDYWFSRSQFVYQDKKPAIVSDDGGFGDCSFHKNYIIASNCSRGWSAQGFHYRVLYLDVQDDGSVVYINNRIIAKLENEEWKSFLFDTYPIYSGTVDGKGYFWLFTTEGLIRLAPESFNSYQGISY